MTYNGQLVLIGSLFFPRDTAVMGSLRRRLSFDESTVVLLSHFAGKETEAQRSTESRRDDER